MKISISRYARCVAYLTGIRTDLLNSDRVPLISAENQLVTATREILIHRPIGL